MRRVLWFSRNRRVWLEKKLFGFLRKGAGLVSWWPELKVKRKLKGGQDGTMVAILSKTEMNVINDNQWPFASCFVAL